jgi:hypothetical protein
MSTIHLFIQRKSGIGNSTAAFYLVQYLMERKKKCLVFDVDQLNPTLSRTVSFEAKVVKIFAADRTTIIKNAFDEMVEACENMESDAVIDVGSSSFIPMLEYCDRNDIFTLWHELGHRCRIHSIITGRYFADTCDWLDEIMRRTRHVSSISADVWLNPFTGPVEKEGHTFEDTIQYRENKRRIRSLVSMLLPENSGMFGKYAFKEMMAAGETFEEYCRSLHFILSRQTMCMFRQKQFAVLDKVRMTD